MSERANALPNAREEALLELNRDGTREMKLGTKLIQMPVQLLNIIEGIVSLE